MYIIILHWCQKILPKITHSSFKYLIVFAFLKILWNQQFTFRHNSRQEALIFCLFPNRQLKILFQVKTIALYSLNLNWICPEPPLTSLQTRKALCKSSPARTHVSQPVNPIERLRNYLHSEKESVRLRFKGKEGRKQEIKNRSEWWKIEREESRPRVTLACVKSDWNLKAELQDSLIWQMSVESVILSSDYDLNWRVLKVLFLYLMTSQSTSSLPCDIEKWGLVSYILSLL